MADPGHPQHPALHRILGELGDPHLVKRLAGDLTAADLTTLLMAVAAARAVRTRASDVLHRYTHDRFARPGRTAFAELRRMEDAFIHAVPVGWDWVTPSPVVPFGAHGTLGDVSQDWVVTTVRPTEVAADPTVALALEAASRRRDTTARRTARPHRLAALQRITRGQRYSSSDALVHFTLFGLVTAGRSEARGAFDAPALLEHVDVHVAALRALAVPRIDVVLSTVADGAGEALREEVARRFAENGDGEVHVGDNPDRLAGQRYYARACFTIHAVTSTGVRIEVADGGFTDWTERLLADRRERLMISGAGLDRPALELSGG